MTKKEENKKDLLNRNLLRGISYAEDLLKQGIKLHPAEKQAAKRYRVPIADIALHPKFINFYASIDDKLKFIP